MFWCVSYCLGAFGTISSPYETLFKTGRPGAINAKVCATKSRQNFFSTNAPDPPHRTLNSWFSALRTICVHLGPFRRLMKLGSKRAELVQLMQKFVPRTCVRIFRNERTRSTLLHPKLMFWLILYCLIAFGTVLSRYETRFKMGRTGAIKAKVRATKLRQNFLQRTHLIHPIGP